MVTHETTRALFVALALALFGCAADARPKAAEYEVPPSDEESVLLRGTAVIAATPAPICTPGTTRKCKIYAFQNGQWYCPVSFQICKSNGYGWRKCGDHSPEPDASVEPEEPSAPEDDSDPLIH